MEGSGLPDPSIVYEMSLQDWEYHLILIGHGNFGTPEFEDVNRTITYIDSFYGKKDIIIFRFTFPEIYQNAKCLAKVLQEHPCNRALQMYFNIVVNNFEFTHLMYSGLKALTGLNKEKLQDVIAAFQLCRETKTQNGTHVFQELGVI